MPLPIRSIAPFPAGRGSRLGHRVPRAATGLVLACSAWILAATPAAAGSWWDGFAGSGWTGCVHAVALHDGQLVAGGSFQVTTPEGTARQVARWDGQAWHPLGNLNGVVHALALHGGELYAGGSLYGVGGDESFGIARWDGSRWIGLGRGTDGGAVYALESYEGSLYAGGTFQRVGAGVLSPHLARWDGTEWRALGAGTDGVVRALEVYRGELWVGGDFDHAGGLDAIRLARWGAAFGWAVVPQTSVNGTIQALGVHAGDLIAAGSFSTVNPWTTSLNIARFRGDIWSWSAFHPFGGGPGPIRTLAPLGTDLVAGGEFGAGSGWPYDHIARAAELGTPSHATPWVEMDQGLNGDVHALVAEGGRLWVGGCFTHAGGLESPGVARWDEGTPLAVAPGSGVWAIEASPNPFTDRVRIRLGVSASGWARLAVHDLQGRRVAVLHEGPLAGPVDRAWSGETDRGGRVPAGVYFVRLDHDGGTLRHRVLRLR